MGADNAEKQGQRTFFSPFPLSHLASTKGCYVTAIYTRAPSPSRPPSSCQAAPREIQMVLQPCAPSRPFLSLIRLLQIMPHSCNLSQLRTALANGKKQGRAARPGSEMSRRRDRMSTAAGAGPLWLPQGPGGVYVPYMQANCRKACASSRVKC